MTDIYQWASRWGINVLALHELRALMLAEAMHPTPPLAARGSGGEADQQNLIRLESPHYGIWLTRNNVGALMDETGRPVRYGLANESAEQNKVIKSADLIGIYPRTIALEDVGKTIGQFVSVECKERGWMFKGTKREVAQQKWANFVIAKGGLATFASEPHHLQNLGVQRK